MIVEHHLRAHWTGTSDYRDGPNPQWVMTWADWHFERRMCDRLEVLVTAPWKEAELVRRQTMPFRYPPLVWCLLGVKVSGL